MAVVDGSEYTPPSLSSPIVLEEQEGPPATEIEDVVLCKPEQPVGENQDIYSRSFESSAFSDNAKIYLYTRYLKPLSIGSGLVLGSHAAYNKTNYILPAGLQALSVGKPNPVRNKNQNILPAGIQSELYGRAYAYNLLKFTRATGFDSQKFGTAYLMGGVKWLRPSGLDSSKYGAVLVVNTTANQQAKPTGFNAGAVPAPNVSPRILYASGFKSEAMGKAHDVRTPVLYPNGLTHTAYGKATIWFHTRPILPPAINTYETGYPKVFDPTKFIYAPSVVQSTVFGDIAIKNKSVRASVPSIFDEVVTPWAIIENQNKYYSPKGIGSQAIGDAAIRNKTPSVFVRDIAAPLMPTPAIGYKVRSIKPTGFDRLALGSPVLTKTPEILPAGIASPDSSTPTVWFKNRTISVQGRGPNTEAHGTATTWFRYRYVKPSSWQSDAFSDSADLSHGTRVVEAKGFTRAAYGTPWVSRGVRYLAPEAVYTDFTTKHMIGGTQRIMPAGYIASLFGTRIIPEARNLYPLGFTGLWGQAIASLYTRYIKPIGYISVGQSPSDRWGKTSAYNKRQYITQNYDGDSGLVPPKWSDWQSIENKNKRINITGFLSQKIGYTKIDNHAAAMLVTSIKPSTPSQLTMIAYANRPILVPGIENAPMSTWAVVHNGARVLAPVGIVATQAGQPIFANTRRYYKNIGMIDSLEVSTPMIAYRIRTIEIERRYSIAPLPINLPTVALYTRYVDGKGYENAKYGLPSLHIHFNVIAPRWVRQDSYGDHKILNVTPEMGARGHNSELFGVTAIRTQWRNVYAQGDNANVFGPIKISDTKQFARPVSWIDTVISQKHKVIKTGTNPYILQNVYLFKESNPDEGYGIEPPKMGVPGLNQNVLYPSGVSAAKFGTAFVRSNVLDVSVGIAIKNFTDLATTVSNKNRLLSVEGIDNEIVVSEELSLSPHVIKPFYFEDYNIPLTRYGHASITLKNRTISAKSWVSSDLDVHKIQLYKRYLTPTSIRPYGVGFPELPNSPREIGAIYGHDSATLGTLVIKQAPYLGPQSITPKGFDSLSINAPRAELYIRSLQIVGFGSLRMGASIAGDTPFMWQGLRIGERVPNIIGGYDASMIGQQRISLRVRELSPLGFDAFLCTYDLTNFKGRMQVIGKRTNYVEDIEVNTNSFDSMVMGSASIKLGQHFIRPDGNSDQFRKSSYSAEFGAPTISG